MALLKNKKVVVFIGGETAGPVMPLLAVAEQWIAEDSHVVPVFFDRKNSVAARVVPKAGFKFRKITAGKLRRYWSFKNLVSPFLIGIGFVQALFALLSLKPIVVVGAGGYVQVPIILAAWILRIPRLIHQQDIIPSISNKLVSVLANKITVTFEKSMKDFPQGTGFEKNFGQSSKVFWTGNPSRLESGVLEKAQSKKEAHKLFHLEADLPTILVMGGGSGAAGLNHVLSQDLVDILEFAQIIHSSGKGKSIKIVGLSPDLAKHYHQHEFIDRMDLALVAADLVIARAGVGTITELAASGKPAIIIPMPESHQEWNAQFLYNAGASVVVDQTDLAHGKLAKLARKILLDAKLQKGLTTAISKIMPKDSTAKMLKQIQSIIHGK